MFSSEKLLFGALIRNRLVPLVVVLLFPLVLTPDLWSNIVRGILPRAWDGSGHYAVAQIYNQSIFPDINGWTGAYFSGMPFPNFYPPLFYWLVALISHTHLVNFETAFKLVICLPVLLLPASIWYFSYQVSDKNWIAATGAAIACTPLLADYRCRLIAPSGLDYVSTFQVGLYTQPLSFILLLFWLSFYLRSELTKQKLFLTSILLALVVLANFFNAVIAVIFIISVLTNDFILWLGETESERKRIKTRQLLFHVVTPIIAFLLTSFWTFPMLLQNDYFVTRPQVDSFAQFIPATLWIWYALSIIGFICWVMRPTGWLIPFLIACLAIEIGVVFAADLQFLSFPLQPLRFLTTLNFLLYIPFGFVAVKVIKIISKITNIIIVKLLVSLKNHPLKFDLQRLSSENAVAYSIFSVAVLVCFWFIKTPIYDRAYYTENTFQEVKTILDFAREHSDGKYLVEIPQDAYSGSMLDARAINSYLGSQGNQVLSVVFREASPNALFFNPQVSVLSTNPDNFGISSVLADDLDFREQPLSNHLKRLQFIGVKYIVIASPVMKKLIGRESDIAANYNLGLWTVFEIENSQTEFSQALHYLPALLVTDLSVKLRAKENLNFVRLAEEQFSDSWFDVLLAHSPQAGIDEIQELNRFGAVILDNYKCRDENAALEKLRDFAVHRPLILLSSDAKLFHRIRNSLDDFPLAQIVQRESDVVNGWLITDSPTTRYGLSSIRQQWQTIKGIIDRYKVQVNPSQFAPESGFHYNSIRINNKNKSSLPILIRNTYHPNWRRNDYQPIYIATPFFQLTFLEEETQINYLRKWSEFLSIIVSLLTFVFLSVFSVCEILKNGNLN